MKFFNLLKKELAELITVQAIASVVVMMALFMLLGNTMNSTVKEAIKQEYTITISDNDKTDFTAQLFDDLRESGASIKEYTTVGEDYAAVMDNAGVENLIIIPAGFSEAIENGEVPELISIERMESAAMMSNVTNSNSGALELIKSCVSNVFAKRSGVTDEELQHINSPVEVSTHTVVGKNSSKVASETVMSKLMMQNMILPIVVFVLIMMTSQMLMSAIANEKIDKTLETLLSAPVSRTAILGAKMLAAAIVALLNAVVYMIGFSSFMSGATGSISDEMSGLAINQYIPIETALEQLGLNLSVFDYVLVGVQLFLTIMICLSISLMLGALVNDTKQAQTMIMPLMFMAMVPYIISMVSDINTLPTVLKAIVYAIPFTHTFSAISNIMFGHMGVFYGGMIYQAVVFVICMFFALKLFSSDKILTISINFGQKLKGKKNKNAEN